MDIIKVVPQCKQIWREWFEVETGELRTFSILDDSDLGSSLIDVKVDKKYDGCYVRVAATDQDDPEKLFYYVIKKGEEKQEIKKARASLMVGVNTKIRTTGCFYAFRMWKGDL